MADNNQKPSNSRMAKLHPKGKPRKRMWLQIIKWLFIVAMLVVVSGVGLFAYYAKDAPSISQAQLQSGGTSSLYTRDGKFLLSLGSEKGPMLIIRKFLKNLKMPLSLSKIGVFTKKESDLIQLELLVLS